MNDIEINVIDIDGNKYFIVDNLTDEKNTYYYFSNIEDNKDIMVLKEKKEDDEDYFVSLDDVNERNSALALFYEKYKDINK